MIDATGLVGGLVLEIWPLILPLIGVLNKDDAGDTVRLSAVGKGARD
jgi:hypothetical protein